MKFSTPSIFTTGILAGLTQVSLATAGVSVPPAPVILISLDGATPRIVEQYLQSGDLPSDKGLGLLRAKGVRAVRNTTVSPSLTAVGHIAIATGSIAAHNDIMANTFHLVSSPLANSISGFGAPIGGYCVSCGLGGTPAESPLPTAEPLWAGLLAHGKKVVGATWPGGDGVDVKIPGLVGSAIVQPASERTVTYTVPFGAFAGVSGRGFAYSASDFSAAPSTVINQLTAAGKVSYSPILQKTSPMDTFTAGGVSYSMRVAALDTTNDGTVNYDTLVFFDSTIGIQPGPFTLPSTGPAYVKFSDHHSSQFYLEGSSSKAGMAYYVTALAPDLSTVHIVHTSANSIPRNAAVLANVDDVNNNVGFWAPQPDFRFPERLNPGLSSFSDLELEEVYQDLVSTWTDYQVRLALRARAANPNADLTMVYFEQPDGSCHQYLLTDVRQPTNPTDNTSIGAGQDSAKVARYQGYVKFAYQQANNAVQRIIDSVGVDANGIPRANILVTSDHGFDTFHTYVGINNFLASRGFNTSQVRAYTSGPAVNFYINLQGRELNGTVTRAQYLTLQKQLRDALHAFRDTNSNYTLGAASVPVFDKIYTRPVPANINDPGFGVITGGSSIIGQDSGDVYALLTVGYNFDGNQTPVVQRLGDPASGSPLFQVPNFYGAHGYDPNLVNMSAIFYAAGPNITPGTLNNIRNIDIAPTISHFFGVTPAATVDGTVLPIFH